MIKSNYQEGLYYREDFHAMTEKLEQQIVCLLRENYGVGIIGGYCEHGFPLCMVSELTLQMLGYDSAAEFEKITGNCMAGLVSWEDYSEKELSEPDGIYELHLRGKNGNLRVRMVKRDVGASEGKGLWLASVCDMDALYQKGKQFDQLLQEKHRQELLQQTKLEQTTRELERKTKELEQALQAAEKNNEVISAIGRIYWMIYQLDLRTGTFEEIAVNGTRHIFTGDRGITAERFPLACKKTIRPEYQKEMQAFLEMKTLKERLRDREEIFQEYQALSGNWHVGRFIVQKRNEKGEPVEVLYTIQIINEQKQREREYEKRLAQTAEDAQKANMSKSDFLRRMSHDIRTPLNGIRGMIEIANYYADDMQKQQEYRDKIWEASGYLMSLVNSVLDMNKLESGMVVLEEVPFDLLKMLKETNTVIEMQAVEHGLEYKTDMEKRYIEHPYLIGSASHLKQILINLASNAVKYNKENGKVTVWCRELSCDGKEAVFQFGCKDTGIGISREFQEHIFEPFSQEGKNNARTHYEGSGLGLSIVKALVEQMGGRITFTSEENVGTTFCVILSFRIDTDLRGKYTEQEEGSVDLSNVRILLAEDNELNMEIVKFFLEQRGAVLTTAQNGQEAVNIFAASKPGEFDLILMDIMMPVMSGYEATEKIRGMERADAKTIPIIAMSANAFQDDIQKSKSAGMNGHLPKPIGMERLLSMIRPYIS